MHICNPAGLSLRQSQLVVSQDGEEVTFLIEDIAYLILDTRQTTITGSVFAAILNAGIAILQSDEKHIPCGIAFPFQAHWKQGETAHLQTSLTQPFKKRAWQAIVRQKVRNQAAVLSILKTEKAETEAAALKAMVAQVKSGDPSNVEARAARAYWGALFKDFRRADFGDRRNAALNYGYAVVRACLARSLSASGLIPAFGLHHASVTNAFNLADDLIEPFRPFVDYMTLKLLGNEPPPDQELTKEDRQAMAQVPFETVMLDGESLSLLLATERTAQKLTTAMRAGDPSILSMPEFTVGQRLL
ncbi:type II CRISPR-associated endonuclease Cas1 [Hyphococcus sp.]|uniref:type II CRISPR-associated endonuclease Cas1 n=1 Tax=Hyphococcus sp. TaxID=2038636 RepID=UPI003CCC3624